MAGSSSRGITLSAVCSSTTLEAASSQSRWDHKTLDTRTKNESKILFVRPVLSHPSGGVFFFF